jgi:hypothetical protein
MAGQGRKVFTAGDVLTASQVQDYLQDQAVMVFAGTAARSSAIASPSEGMFAVVTDTDQLTYYNGSTWNIVAQLNNNSIPFAMNVGSQSITGSGTIVYTTSRFSVVPNVFATVGATSSTRTSVTLGVAGTTSFNAYVWSGTSAATVAATVYWQAIQMTSTTASG